MGCRLFIVVTMAVVAAVIGGTAITQITRLSASMTDMYGQNLLPVAQMGNLRQAYMSYDMTGKAKATAQLKTDLDQYRQVRDQQLVPALRAGDTAAADKLRTTSFGAVNKAVAADLDALVALVAPVTP